MGQRLIVHTKTSSNLPFWLSRLVSASILADLLEALVDLCLLPPPAPKNNIGGFNNYHFFSEVNVFCTHS